MKYLANAWRWSLLFALMLLGYAEMVPPVHDHGPGMALVYSVLALVYYRVEIERAR